MFKKIIIFVILALCVGLGFYLYSANQPKTKISSPPEVGINEDGQLKNEHTIYLVAPEYVPYYGSELEEGGFISEVIVEAYKRSGYNVEFEFMPWSRALEDVKRGDKDGIYTLWYRQDREEFFAYSNPIPTPNKLKLVALSERQDIDFKEYYDLRGYTVGAVQDYTYPEDFLNSQINFSLVTDDVQNMRKLFARRVDVVAIDQLQGIYITQEEELGDVNELRWLEPAMSTEEQYVGISRKTENFAEKLIAFNEGLEEIVNDGTLAGIVKKHGYDFNQISN